MHFGTVAAMHSTLILQSVMYTWGCNFIIVTLEHYLRKLIEAGGEIYNLQYRDIQ